ncbi:MAG: DciA family protein [Cyanobacteria bacterium P01_A01_bin.83]
MHFNSLEQILTHLEQQPGWEKLRQYRQLLKCWHNTVNQTTAQHTRPLHINLSVFWVATSSAARAQELTFQRYTLLKRLNQQLPFPLKDIRFTTSGWEQSPPQRSHQTSLFKVSTKYKFGIGSTSKISVTDETKQPSSSSSITAKEAAQRWLQTLTPANSATTNCPGCNALISKGELERWNLCYHCVAHQWSQEYCPPTFPSSE